jgi:glycosyltransferase involved in cell wall biosynthesis
VSVVIPARNEAPSIAAVVQAVLRQSASGVRVEVLVVDDGSTDGTGQAAAAAGARVLRLEPTAGGGNPARARNRGAAEAHGDPIVFLDADCTPAPGWLAALLAAHDSGAAAVGGSLALPPGLPLSARCDYYCGWYHVHPRRGRGSVVNHPPGNLSVRRSAFAATRGYSETYPLAYSKEELGWQADLRSAGHSILFEPAAVAYHRNRPGFGNLLRRNYRWAYTAVESKATTGAARMAWMYRHPRLVTASSVVAAPLHTAYVVACWVRAGVLEPLLLLPVVFAARVAYAAGMLVGGLRWLRRPDRSPSGRRSRWE